MTGGDVITRARAAFPGCEVRMEGEGQLSTAIRVGDELVARFPKHALGVERLRFEVSLLEHVRPALTMRVPDIVQVELDRPVGDAFVAHRLIEGELLTADLLATMPDQRVDAIAAPVGTFLREFHGLTPVALGIGVPQLSAAEFADSLAIEVESLLAPRMSAAAADRAGRELAALKAIAAAPDVLAHTDIGGNILVSADDEVVVIDFGSCMVTHSALDVASLSVLGDDFVTRCARTYPALRDSAEAARAVRGTFALQDALYGARQQDWPYVDDILNWYSTPVTP